MSKENFVEGIRALRVGVTQENGNITGFVVEEPDTVVDREVGLIAFAATAL
jgi:hypothetical protein